MFSKSLRKLGLISCVVVLASCGLFSENKDIPTGTRVSVLNKQALRLEQATVIPEKDIPLTFNNQSWLQTGGESHHVMGNLSVSENPKELWKESFGEGGSERDLLLAQPVVHQGIVYVQDVEGTVSAFHLENGKKVWKKKLKPLHENDEDNSFAGSGLSVSNQYVFATTGFGSVFALNSQTGEIVWRRDLNTPLRTAPTTCQDALYIQTLDNKIIALNQKDGQDVWEYGVSLESTVLAGSSSPTCLAEKDFLVVGFSNGDIQALNSKIGYPLWSASLINRTSVNVATDINAVKAPAVIDGDLIFAVGHNNMIAAFDYRTGEQIWAQKIGSTNMPWVVGNYLFVLSINQEIIALNKQTGQVLWQKELLKEYKPEKRSGIYLLGPIMIDGHIFVVASNGKSYLISSSNGDILRQIDFGEDVPVAPIVADNKIIFTTNDAELIVYQ